MLVLAAAVWKKISIGPLPSCELFDEIYFMKRKYSALLFLFQVCPSLKFETKVKRAKGIKMGVAEEGFGVERDTGT